MEFYLFCVLVSILPVNAPDQAELMQTNATVHVQTGDSNMCLAYYEHQCAGICSSEERLEPIYEACLRDPLKKGQNARQSAIS